MWGCEMQTNDNVASTQLQVTWMEDNWDSLDISVTFANMGTSKVLSYYTTASQNERKGWVSERVVQLAQSVGTERYPSVQRG